MIQMLVMSVLLAFSFQLFSMTRAHGVLARTWAGISKEMLYGSVVIPFGKNDDIPCWDVKKASESIGEYFSSSFDPYQVRYDYSVTGSGEDPRVPTLLTISLQAELGKIEFFQQQRVFEITKGDSYE